METICLTHTHSPPPTAPRHLQHATSMFVFSPSSVGSPPSLVVTPVGTLADFVGLLSYRWSERHPMNAAAVLCPKESISGHSHPSSCFSNLSTPLPRCSPTLGWGKEQSTKWLSAVWPLRSFCINSDHWREKLLWPRAALIYAYKHKYSEGSLATCHLAKQQ